jgi:hypothetical protein
MSAERYRIRNWEINFERDRTKQWKKMQWVPMPNKQGSGYRKIMKQKNGAEIFGCWCSIVQVASLCSPRGDLSKYTIEELSDLTMINLPVLQSSIDYLSQVLDWIEVIKNLDINVKKIDPYSSFPSSSIPFNSIPFHSVPSEGGEGGVHSVTPGIEDFFERFRKAYPPNGSCVDPQAIKNFSIAMSSGVDPEQMIRSANEYAEYYKLELGDKYPHGQYVAQAANWIRKGQYSIDWSKRKESVTSKKTRREEKAKGECDEPFIPLEVMKF